MTTTSNAYCAALGIHPPRIEDARSSPDASFYSLLLVALLERGEPMPLEEVAARFAATGIAPTADQALVSLKRCKPARAPIYRDGDLYALDPHDDEVGFWLFRLGLRPARGAPLQTQRSYGPLPSPAHPVTVAALDEAWRDGVPNSWSAQRVAVAVLDAHQSAMSGRDVMAFVSARSRWSPLRAESARFWRSGALVVRKDDLWELDPRHDAVRSMREAVRDRVSDLRRSVRALLRTLAVDPGERRLAELGPPQKTRQLNRRGRTLTITTALLVQGSCGISRPFGDERTMREYLRSGADARLRRRLEADAKSLYALYQYGRLHGCLRLRWGFLDEMLPAPWVHRDESTLYHLLKDAHERDVSLEVVVGSAPGWTDPWSRVRRAHVATDAWHSPSLLVDEDGYEIPRAEVQLARLADGSQGIG